MIQTILSQTGCQLTDLAAVAMVSGPGSFTGLRIGAAVCQGLAFGADLPVLPVSALMMQARAARQHVHLPVLAACLMHAREDEFYFAVYRDQGDTVPEAVLADGIVSREWLETQLPQLLTQQLPGPEKLVLTGIDWDKHNLKNLYDQHNALVFTHPADARDLASLALQMDLQTQGVAPELALPVYLQEEMAYRTVTDQA